MHIGDHESEAERCSKLLEMAPRMSWIQTALFVWGLEATTDWLGHFTLFTATEDGVAFGFYMLGRNQVKTQPEAEMPGKTSQAEEVAQKQL